MFSFFQIFILFLLFLYCMGLLTTHMWPVLFPLLYFSSVATVNLHQGISTLLPLPYLWKLSKQTNNTHITKSTSESMAHYAVEPAWGTICIWSSLQDQLMSVPPNQILFYRFESWVVPEKIQQGCERVSVGVPSQLQHCLVWDGHVICKKDDCNNSQISCTPCKNHSLPDSPCKCVC